MKQLLQGFLVVKTFERLYREFVDRRRPLPAVYAVPRPTVRTNQVPKRYRGIDRDALGAWNCALLSPGIFAVQSAVSEPEACQRLHELEQSRKSDGFMTSDLTDARSVLSVLRSAPEYEIIWASSLASQRDSQTSGVLLGYEPTWLDGSRFSALCDCMCFPRWHGTDPEGALFAPYFEMLNEHALFSTPQAAQEFLDFYLAQSWTEHGDYLLTEVRLPD